MLLITVSRQTGSLGDEIAEEVSRNLGLPIITRQTAMSEWLPEIAGKHELHMLSESPGYYLNPSQSGITYAEFLENKLRMAVKDHSAIISGMGAQVIFALHPEAVHIKIMASQEVRIGRIMKSNHLDRKDSERLLEITDRKHKRYISMIYEKDWADPLLYDLTLNTDKLSIKDAAEAIACLVRNRLLEVNKIAEANGNGTKKAVVFKHPSEEEFARILDMYCLEWEYEPRTFPIKWDAEGNIILAFSPDFYLPKFDTYIELTTMNQKYVSEKKKKVEQLRKLYPGTNINIVYKKDFHTLIKRFGMLGGKAGE
ncbi:cytidylate kinase family protein [Youngiibacter multivorans]|uniref:Cytidylate kinase n=1 Tax=Youngiibacter multivorans TaxID=937251 RepID=A0ABS4G448_9CLOT|nr:cytidylate kinase family protein [Youngiibacter multivorans]MBP1919309.1 cytidylate kinase [Youngiibacter multivorans]